MQIPTDIIEFSIKFWVLKVGIYELNALKSSVFDPFYLNLIKVLR